MEVLTALADKLQVDVQKPCNCNAKNQGCIMWSPTQNSAFAFF